MKQNNALLDALKEAMQLGVDLNDEEQRNAVFDKVTFRVKYLDENSERLHGTCILNLAISRWKRLEPDPWYEDCYSIPGSYDILKPNYHDWKTDYLCHHETSGLYRERGKTSCT